MARDKIVHMTEAELRAAVLEMVAEINKAAAIAQAATTVRTILVLPANGETTWTFPSPFDAKPVLGYMAFNPAADGQPITVEAVSWVMSGTRFAGIKIKAYRTRRQLPSMSLDLLNYITVETSNMAGIEVHMRAGKL